VTTTGDDQELVRIDAHSNKVAATTTLPAGAVGARAGLGGLWVTNPTSGTALRIDPESGRTLSEVHSGLEARFFDVGEGGVWVQNNGDGTASRLDPETNKVTVTVQVDESPISGGDLAARVSSALVAKIDPQTNTVLARYGPGPAVAAWQPTIRPSNHCARHQHGLPTSDPLTRRTHCGPSDDLLHRVWPNKRSGVKPQ
jgi:DNA-binding beta-propeller fold protein YncE